MKRERVFRCSHVEYEQKRTAQHVLGGEVRPKCVIAIRVVFMGRESRSGHTVRCLQSKWRPLLDGMAGRGVEGSRPGCCVVVYSLLAVTPTSREAFFGSNGSFVIVCWSSAMCFCAKSDGLFLAVHRFLLLVNKVPT